jgi:thiamine biosynthesis lipoprotein
MTVRFWWAVGLVCTVVVAAVWQQYRSATPGPSFTLLGETMGTTYTVSAHGAPSDVLAGLPAEIEARLRAINKSMSTWDPASEISRINEMPAGQRVTVSEDFDRVLSTALSLSEATDGAFDVTVGPLVNLWGFGPTAHDQPPSAAALAAARRRTGYGNLIVNGRSLTKRVAGMYLDFSGIAKGYGVDAVAEILHRRGIGNYMVEIGGEVAVAGREPGGEPWAIGIESPEENAARGAALYAVVHLTQGALATSGSYRRFKRRRAQKSHHIIDPRTGMSTNSGLVSVTVFAADSMTADGIATALMVMGAEAGLQWVEARPGVEALFLEATPDGGFAQRLSPGFGRLVQ